MNKIKNVNNIPYIRILAFNDKGREIIKNIKTNSDINIINKFETCYNLLGDKNGRVDN